MYTQSPLSVELTGQGYLHLSAEVAREYFPQDVLVALPKGREMWLLPTRGAEAGGLLLKQRNPRGDRSVLIWEALPPGTSAGSRLAFWDPQQGALRVAIGETRE